MTGYDDLAGELAADPELAAMISAMDVDALDAGVALVARCGAKEFKVGYSNDDATSMEDADWYAEAYFNGVRVFVEHHRGPVEAVEALARRLLRGAKCVNCGRLIALNNHGTMHYPDTQYVTPAHLREGLSEKSRAAIDAPPRLDGVCRWRRIGPRWEGGCATAPPAPSGKSTPHSQPRNKRGAARKARARRNNRRGRR